MRSPTTTRDIHMKIHYSLLKYTTNKCIIHSLHAVFIPEKSIPVFFGLYSVHRLGDIYLTRLRIVDNSCNRNMRETYRQFIPFFLLNAHRSIIQDIYMQMVCSILKWLLLQCYVSVNWRKFHVICTSVWYNKLWEHQYS